jgi:alkylation response protein AidB-like acyl-CoA dehydrogenase
MKDTVERTVRYTLEREQFGRPIAKFQAVRHMLADMRIRYELSRNLVYRVAWHLDQDDDPPLVDAAVAKVFTTEAAQKNARDAIQIHGGNGFTSRVPRRARPARQPARHHRRRHQRDPARDHRPLYPDLVF